MVRCCTLRNVNAVCIFWLEVSTCLAWVCRHVCVCVVCSMLHVDNRVSCVTCCVPGSCVARVHVGSRNSGAAKHAAKLYNACLYSTWRRCSVCFCVCVYV